MKFDKTPWAAAALLAALALSSCGKDEARVLPREPLASEAPTGGQAESPVGDAAPPAPVSHPVQPVPGRVTSRESAAPASSASFSTGSRRVALDPEELRKKLIEGNVSVQMAFNRVHRAKDSVNLARSQLFPSLNLGNVLLSGGSATFILSSIDVLLPFLLPSRWLDFKRSKDLFEAEKVAFRLVELNQYASAYSLYFTILSDLEVLDFLAAEAEDFRAIHGIIQQTHDLGLASPEDVLLAETQKDFAEMAATRVRELVVSEHAALRQALALSYDDAISLKPATVEPSEWEGKPLAQALDEALARSPERAQLAHLADAARREKWSRVFGFLGNASMGSNGGGNGESASLAFSELTGRVSMSLGYSQIPTIALSERNRAELEIRAQEIRLELARSVEVALGQLGDARKRLALATRAEQAIRAVYGAKLAKFELGLESMLSVLQARGQIRDAAIQRIRTTAEIHQLRVTLHRVMLTDQFARIEGCSELEYAPQGGGFFLKRWFGKLFGAGGSGPRMTIEQACGRVPLPAEAATAE
jgi:outer membrane protein, multidrug efflux system